MPNTQSPENKNLDPKTVKGFGEEWSTFTQQQTPADELQRIFNSYFAVFPWEKLPANARGFDLGCGSGRWAKFVAPRVGFLQLMDASPEALNVARQNLAGSANVGFECCSVDRIPFADASFDFGYSLGVLHHVPDTAAGIKACVQKLKAGAPFLVYLYYAFDNRPFWFRAIWKLSDFFRQIIARSPFALKRAACDAIALLIYLPLARAAKLAERIGANPDHWPLSSYRDKSFYTMRTDSLDRFGTRLEQRFRADQIEKMMEQAGLRDITFHQAIPYWCAVGTKG